MGIGSRRRCLLGHRSLLWAGTPSRDVARVCCSVVANILQTARRTDDCRHEAGPAPARPARQRRRARRAGAMHLFDAIIQGTRRPVGPPVTSLRARSPGPPGAHPSPVAGGGRRSGQAIGTPSALPLRHEHATQAATFVVRDVRSVAATVYRGKPPAPVPVAWPEAGPACGTTGAGSRSNARIAAASDRQDG